MCTHFKTEADVAQNQIDDFFSIGWILSAERAEAATNSYSAAVDFLQYIYSVLVAKNH